MMLLCIFLVLLSEICQVLAVDNTSGIIQDSGVRTAVVGQTVTLKCACRDNAVTFFSWYQQTLGGKPLIISTRMRHNAEATINAPYKDRFKVTAESQTGINDLTISHVKLSDTATYYCGILEFNTIEFGQGVLLNVKTSLSNNQTVVYQPAWEAHRLGESVNLRCTVYADKCAGEKSLYWFRHGAAQPAIMYRSVGQCVNESHVKNCTLNLTIKSMNSSDAGTYYCALTSCGEIVFGNGTRLEIAGDSIKAPPLLVYCLSVAFVVSIILLLALSSVMYKLNKKTCSVCRGKVSHLTCPAASDVVQSQDEDVVHYAALNMNKTSVRQRQEENAESVCVYSRVKCRKQ
ncbi:immunoglobulin kappa light chain-like isoform X2 [Chaetodon trifascialis]|uniref:immunoglobulin kappa light chain-like isoform X2 n=1 Tax=Chaetodon trifascialis TaxID=109706 RepID=UPI00399399F2